RKQFSAPQTKLFNLNMWAISPEERVKHDQKFDTLSPSMGYVTGEQARKFFLQSGCRSASQACLTTSPLILHCHCAAGMVICLYSCLRDSTTNLLIQFT
uniref:EH domain-containing protein n=1 Tax=Oryzias melastigma TaxID=30732 RepID=A0A3B3BUN8_ORYME